MGEIVVPELGTALVGASYFHQFPRWDREAQNGEDRLVVAGRIRRPWEAWECAAMGPVVGLELVGVGAMAERIGVEVAVGEIRADRVRGWAGSGGCSCR